MVKPEFLHAGTEANRGTSVAAGRVEEETNGTADEAQVTARRPVSSERESRIRIAETFVSRQGEGKLTGTPSFFIRTSGCNLRCWFCDTPYASWEPEGETFGVPELFDAARRSGVRHVVLTGGEPLIVPAAAELCRALRAAGLHVTIETAGTVDAGAACDLLSLSPKLRSSLPDAAAHPRWHRQHESRRMPIAIMKRLIDRAADHQLKFVVTGEEDGEEIRQVVEALQVRPERVWIMPEGTTAEALNAAAGWLRPWAEAEGFRYCDRMQIRWYGNRRGT